MNSKSASFAFLVLSIVISVQSRPLDDEDVEIELAPPLKLDPSRLKQEDTEDEDAETTTLPYQFGAQVAQIITGAVTGDLSTILKGSFGLVPNPQTSNAINGAWGTIAGITSTTTTTTTTTEATTTAAATEPTARVVEPTQPTEGPEPPVVEEETEEPKFEEGSSSTTTESDSDEKVSSTTVGEDDDDEEAEAEELDRETNNISDNETSNLEDNSVFSRSKVLRVI